MAYATAAQLRYDLGIDSNEDDTMLSTLAADAQEAIDTYCHRTFEASADTTRYIDAVGEHVRGRVLFVDHVGDLCAITTVTNGDGVAVAGNERITEPRNETPYTAVRLLGSSGKSWAYSTDWEGAISILGRWAYSTTAPADINRACRMLAAFYYRQKDLPYVDVTAVEAGIVVRPTGMPAAVKQLLVGYVKL
jgi:hypothetical protein